MNRSLILCSWQAVLIVGTLFVSGAALPVRGDGIGNPNPGNGWSTAGAVTVSASSSHGSRPVIHTIDGSGIDATGALHRGSAASGDPGPYMWLSGPVSSPVSRGGTVTGSHWIQFAFNQVYELGLMWI